MPEVRIMITKYRNRGIMQLTCAIGLTAMLISLAIWEHGPHTSDSWIALAIFLYLASWAAWLSASFNLAKAKGYGPDYFGAILVFLFLFSLCFPVALFVFPLVAIFGLKDRTRERRW